MTPDTALRILGLSGSPARLQLDEARRRLLSAVHPDKHQGAHSEVFARLARDVNEAYDVLLESAVQASLRDDASLEDALFAVNASSQWSSALAKQPGALARFDNRYAKDRIVAVAVLGLDPNFRWYNTNGFTGAQTQHTGTALYVLVWNRTRRRVESLDIQQGILVDDLGNQYSCESNFYWTEGDGQFNRHDNTVVPNAKLDGFLLYPALRAGATAFTRWYLADSLKVGDKYIDAEYDVSLPREAQVQARLKAPGLVDDDEDVDDFDDDDFDDEDSEDEGDNLSDDWLYGRK